MLNVENATARIVREMRDSESAIDDALVTTTALLHSAALALRGIDGAKSAKSQAAIGRMHKMIADLVCVQNDAMRTHGQLLDIAREMGATERPTCPEYLEPSGEAGVAIAA